MLLPEVRCSLLRFCVLFFCKAKQPYDQRNNTEGDKNERRPVPKRRAVAVDLVHCAKIILLPDDRHREEHASRSATFTRKSYLDRLASLLPAPFFHMSIRISRQRRRSALRIAVAGRCAILMPTCGGHAVNKSDYNSLLRRSSIFLVVSKMSDRGRPTMCAKWTM